MSVIQTQQLRKIYGNRVAVESLDLQVQAGEIFGFLGPNGAGKSTTIRILMGFLQPHGGSARIDGLDCWSQSARIKKHVGYLPGDPRLYWWMTGRTALRIVGESRGMDLSARGAELADRFGLELHLRVGRMSRGTRQKLGLLLALAHQPRVLILDEPTSGLDPIIQKVVAQTIRESAAAGGTVFFSSHTLSEVEQLCDRVAIVRAGRIVADERLETLRARARRTVELNFAESAGPLSGLPPFLELLHRNGTRWTCALEGPATPLIEWAARQPLVDLAISPPDLESLFHSYYEN